MFRAENLPHKWYLQGTFRLRGGIWQTERQLYGRCSAAELPRGDSESQRDPSELPSCFCCLTRPLGAQGHRRAPPPPSLSCAGTDCSPPCWIYLFILHQQGCCRLILAWFKKRERKKKKTPGEMLSGSFLYLGFGSSGRSSNSGRGSERQAGGRVAGQGV